jgi:hypothetical protein
MKYVLLSLLLFLICFFWFGTAVWYEHTPLGKTTVLLLSVMTAAYFPVAIVVLGDYRRRTA